MYKSLDVISIKVAVSQMLGEKRGNICCKKNERIGPNTEP